MHKTRGFTVIARSRSAREQDSSRARDRSSPHPCSPPVRRPAPAGRPCRRSSRAREPGRPGSSPPPRRSACPRRRMRSPPPPARRADELRKREPFGARTPCPPTKRSRPLAPRCAASSSSPSDADYDAARALYNGMIDKRPRLIARCVDVADVIAAVTFGRDQGLLVAIRGGGHNGPGLGSCNDGLVIDLSHDEGRARGSREPHGPRGCRAARRATWITPPTRSAWRCPSASSRPPASRASPSAAGPATSRASTASRSTTCSKRTWSSPTAAS